MAAGGGAPLSYVSLGAAASTVEALDELTGGAISSRAKSPAAAAAVAAAASSAVAASAAAVSAMAGGWVSSTKTVMGYCKCSGGRKGTKVAVTVTEAPPNEWTLVCSRCKKLHKTVSQRHDNYVL